MLENGVAVQPKLAARFSGGTCPAGLPLDDRAVDEGVTQHTDALKDPLRHAL